MFEDDKEKEKAFIRRCAGCINRKPSKPHYFLLRDDSSLFLSSNYNDDYLKRKKRLKEREKENHQGQGFQLL